jgi:hypothetical protein
MGFSGRSLLVCFVGVFDSRAIRFADFTLCG